MNVRLLLLFVVLYLSSCNQSNELKSLNGKWNNTDLSNRKADFLAFDGINTLTTKHQKFRYLGKDFFPTEDNKHLYSKSIFNLTYNIDSIDINNGYYYTISNDSFSERRYALVDYPFLIHCGIKPKPKDRSFIYWPQVYLSDKVDTSSVKSNYHHYDFILSDTMALGEIVLYFNNQSIKSSIKTKNNEIELDHLGVIDIEECFDVRYYVFEKYRAFIKNNNLNQIPFLHKNVHFGYSTISKADLIEKKKYISRFLPTDSSRCLVFSNLNMGRWYFEENHSRKLKDGDVISLDYTTREHLFKEYDRRYYGDN